MVRLDTEKYKNDGWGLSKLEFDMLYNELRKIDPTKEYNVVEFGSGRSTEFLCDSKLSLILKMNIFSFDDSPEYAFKGTNEKRLNLKIVPLVETDDASFEEMFIKKKYDASKMKLRLDPPHTRQKNTFYKIEDGMIPSKVDMLIVDGPHGNGRSLAYLHCYDKLLSGSIILIDDASHYPFFGYLKKLRDDIEIIHQQHIRTDKWSSGGDFILCKVMGNL